MGFCTAAAAQPPAACGRTQATDWYVYLGDSRTTPDQLALLQSKMTSSLKSQKSRICNDLVLPQDTPIDPITGRKIPPAVPVPGTQNDVATAITQTMNTNRSSNFGNTANFPWGPPPGTSPTHITAYNCAQRFSADSNALSECVAARR